MRTFRRWAIIPVVTLALSVAACGSDDNASSTSPSSPTSTASTTPATASTPTTTPQTLPAEPVGTVPTSDPATSGVVEISVTAGVDSGEDRIEQIPLGSTVKLTVINPDRDDEFHVHGYDLGDGVEIKAGEPEVFTFTADQAGEFEVESHTTDVVLLILQVS